MKYLVCITMILLSTSSFAETLRVETDGSGDYTVIQWAVNAAAEGDTILVGPGFYGQRSDVVTPGWTRKVNVQLDKDHLTIIGAGPDSTIIGGAIPWVWGTDETMGFASSSYWGSNDVHIEGLKIQNTTYGFIADQSVNTTIINCEYEGCYYSLITWGGAVIVRNTHFLNQLIHGAHFSANTLISASIIDCVFDDTNVSNYFSKHISLESSQSVTISGSTFLGSAVGIAGHGSHVTVSDCRLEEIERFSIDTGIFPSTMIINNCQIRDTGIGILMESRNTNLEVSNTFFDGIGDASFVYESLGTGFIKDSNLCKGDTYVVRGPADKSDEPTPEIHFDMRNNWWGTTDQDSIQAWIYDSNEEPVYNYFIDWFPFLGAP